jgi:hypothetical protein
MTATATCGLALTRHPPREQGRFEPLRRSRNRIGSIGSAMGRLRVGQSNLRRVGSSQGACRSAEGKIWFPTAKGIAIVDPATSPLTVRSAVVIEEMLADGLSIDLHSARRGLRPKG